MRFMIIFIRCPLRIASKRLSPFPGLSQLEIKLARSGRLFKTHSTRRLKSGNFSNNSGVKISTANKGIKPTIERTFRSSASPFSL